MKVPASVAHTRLFLRSVPTKYYAILGVLIVIAVYSSIFFIPKQVTFSFAGETCAKQLTIFPNLQKANSDKYQLSFKNEWTIAGVALLSTKACFDPLTAPKNETVAVAHSPFGGPLFRKMFAISSGDSPKIVEKENVLIPATKPYQLAMSSIDVIYHYKLSVGSKSAECDVDSNALLCDVPALKLKQGKKYEYTLLKQFRSESPVEVQRANFTTLKAVKVVKSDIKNNQTIYTKPKSFKFTTDKPITQATIEVTSNKKAVPTTTKVDEKEITVRFDKELPREKAYELKIMSLDARDGSTLVDPYKRTFTTSGGPKVTNVSVSKTGVPQSAAVVLSFDQKLSKKQDIRKLIAFSGGNATIQRLNDTQVGVQLNSLPLCKAFSISIAAGLKSEHDLESSKKWNFSSRTVCYTTTQYGASVQGRPLIAYSFGSSGPTTMYVGAIHGNESSSSGLMQAWIQELERNPNRIQGKRIIIIPTINPDGVAVGSRTNSRGVNLNRNFPTSNWTSDIKDTDGTHKNGGGKKPLSEPEASALASYTQQVRPKLLLSFHAIGSLVAGDPGGYSAQYAAKYASMVGYRDTTNAGASSTFDYDITGSYEEWTYRSIGIPSMVIELGSYGYYSFPTHQAALWAMVQ